MKPLRLSLEAFGPYLKKAELDFTQLEQNALFLITGPTGGGKTTLLDAMSFALYCRATGGRRDFTGMRCASAPEDLPTTVEFDFSLQGNTYRFRRSLFVRVNRNTKQPQLRDTHECFLEENGEMRLLESGSESAVRRRAEELLCLTCEQFSQVIVLPQGDFLRLLRANSREKAEMLETLFSAGLWKSITERLSAKSKALEGELRQLSAMRSSLLEREQLETPEALAAALEQAARQEAQSRQEGEALALRLKEKEDLLRLAEEYFRRKAQWEKAKKQEAEILKQLAACRESAVHTEEKRKRAAALRTQAVAVVQEVSALEQQLSQLSQAEELKERHRQAGLRLQEAQAQLKVIQEEAAQLKERLVRGEAFVEQARASYALLPSLLEEGQRLEKCLSAYTELQELAKARQETEAALGKKERDQKAAALLAESLSQKLSGQEAVLRGNAALSLARRLKPQEPCPVCGSLQHPSPAAGEERLLDQGELELLREQEKAARETALRQTAQCGALQESLCQAKAKEAAQKTQWESFGISWDTAKQQQAENKALFQKHRAAAEKLDIARKKLSSLREAQEKQARREKEASAAIAALAASAEETKRALEKQAAASPGLNREALTKAVAAKRGLYESLEKESAGLMRECEGEASALQASEAAFQAAQKAEKEAREELQALLVPWDTPPELEVLHRETRENRERSLALSEGLGRLKGKVASLKRSLQAITELDEKLREGEKVYSRTAKLSRSLAGNNPLKTPILQYVLSIMLDEVLESANRFFGKLSRGRYALRRMEGPKGGHALGGLDIEVMDGASMLPRSIETLSGGEQFLASLSLAFGLSDVVQSHSGAVRLDALFIDEGFGSLDGETLDIAMKALAMIRSGGRLVGIISHVSELRGRISSRIEVTKDSGGFAKAVVKN